MALLKTLALIILLSIFPQTTCQCDIENLRSCYRSYMSEYVTLSLYDQYPIYRFMSKLSLLGGHPDKFCEPFNNLTECIGDVEYCINRESLAKITPAATDYLIDYKKLALFCENAPKNGVIQTCDKPDTSSCTLNSTDCEDVYKYYECIIAVVYKKCEIKYVFSACKMFNIDMEYGMACTHLFDCSAYLQPRDPKTCYSNYFGNYGYTDGFPPTFEEFEKVKHQEKFNRPPDYFTAYMRKDDSTPNCGNFKKLAECIGRNEGVVPEDIVGVFDSESDGRQYLLDYKKSEYQCGEGKNASKLLIKCNLRIFSSACNSTFSNCSSAHAYYQCLSNYYFEQCGQQEAVYICNLGNMNLKYNMSCPNLLNCQNYPVITKLSGCYYNYFKNFGFKHGFPANFEEYLARKDDLLQSNRNAIDSGCAYYDKLRKCLGHAKQWWWFNYRYIDPRFLGFVATKQSFIDIFGFQGNASAIDYWVDFKKMENICLAVDRYKAAYNCGVLDLSECHLTGAGCASLSTYFKCFKKAVYIRCGIKAAKYVCEDVKIEMEHGRSCRKADLIDC